MEPVVMAISHTSASFDGKLPFSQLLSSRSENLNIQAQVRALAQEEMQLASLQNQIINSEPLNPQDEIFGDNTELIQHLNQKIKETLKKKFDLIEWYIRTVLKECQLMVEGKQASEYVDVCLNQKREVGREIKFYDSELEHLQRRRAHLWDGKASLHDSLLSYEKKHSGKLDANFQHYSSLLEKIYLRNNKNNDFNCDKKILKKFIAKQCLPTDFKTSSKGISYKQTQEIKARFAVAETENAINGEDTSLNLNPLNKELSSDPNKNPLAKV